MADPYEKYKSVKTIWEYTLCLQENEICRSLLQPGRFGTYFGQVAATSFCKESGAIIQAIFKDRV